VDFLSSLSSRNQSLLTCVHRQITLDCRYVMAICGYILASIYCLAVSISATHNAETSYNIREYRTQSLHGYFAFQYYLNSLIFIIYSFKNHFITLLPLITNWDIHIRAQSQRINLSGQPTLTTLLSTTVTPSSISPIMPSEADIHAAAVEERKITKE